MEGQGGGEAQGVADQKKLVCLKAIIDFRIPESPRWLLVHGKKDQALKVFQDVSSKILGWDDVMIKNFAK
jgi:hypothetical protein